ncbi:MAG: K(+)/H(+) antiporter NhaP [Legionellaceae bacterium]
MDFTHRIIFLIALLLLVSILASIITEKAGCPLLLIFLILGMVAGKDGLGGILFENYVIAHFIGILALAVILFDGGLKTKMKTFKMGLYPAISLSTIGVLITSLLTGLLSAWILHISWIKGMLLGAILAPTDVAAVFSLSDLRKIGIDQHIIRTIEIESGSNDPMSIFMTITLINLLAADENTLNWHIMPHFLINMGLGAILGILGGYIIVKLVNYIKLPNDLYPILVMSGGLLIYAFTQLIEGNGFLAIYLAGLIIGNSELKTANNIFNIHNSLAWLSQISMFLMLGLLVTPSELWPQVKISLIIAFILIFIARPIATYLCLLPFQFNNRQLIFISWVGLKGAVPIILALFPSLSGIADAKVYFHITFFVVLISLTIQGWTVIPLARFLKLTGLMKNKISEKESINLEYKNDK